MNYSLDTLVHKVNMYTPKRLKWHCLSDFRDFLMRETTEKIVSFNGYRLITETSEYGLLDGTLLVYPKQKKILEPKLELGNRPPQPKVKKVKEVKPKSKKEKVVKLFDNEWQELGLIWSEKSVDKTSTN